MPGAHRLGCTAIADQHRIDGGPEESLDQARRRGVGADEVAKRSEDRAFPENRALLEQSGSRGSETDALSLETFERVEFGGERGVQLVDPQQLGSRGALAIASLIARIARFVCGGGGLGETRGRDCRSILGGSQVAARCFGGVEEMGLLGLQRGTPSRQFLTLALGALPIEVRAVKLLAQLTERSLALLEARARDTEVGAHFFLVPRMRGKCVVGILQRALERGELTGRALELGADATGDRVALASLFLGARATRHRVAESFFRDGDLATQLLGALSLVGHESRQLGATGFGVGPLGERGFAR